MRQIREILRMAAAGAVVCVGAVVGGCPAAPKDQRTAPATSQAVTNVGLDIVWRAKLARRESSYVRMDLPVVMKGMRVEIGKAADGGNWEGVVGLYTTRVVRGGAEGPLVDQLTGSAKAASDLGSYLVPLTGEENDGGVSFVVPEPMPLFLKVVATPGQEPGKYEFPVTISAPGRPAGAPVGLGVEVSEIALPTEPRILGVVTTTTEDLARIFPDSFGNIVGAYLDRRDADDDRAVEQLDALVRTAQRDGLALFVEDLGPRVKVDNVGAVMLDWDAYDRVMQPYMDGMAFADHVPLPVWVAPVPPRRVRDTAIQLRQYVAGCAEHFVAKGWVATPAFMHPALIEPEEGVDEKLREEISKVLKLHMTRDMLAVTTPDAAVVQARLWVVDDSDPRLPPAGALGTEQSVRLWPWVCAARGVKGFVWRGGVAGIEELKNVGGSGAGGRPLLVAGETAEKPEAGSQKPEDKVFATLRMAWLHEGMNDTAMLGLLEKRSDPAVVKEVLAGVVGRTGLTPPQGAEQWPEETGKPDLPTAPAGFLYAGWLGSAGGGKETWAAMPGMMEKLVAANDPGRKVTVSADDPVYLAAKLWLAKAHRPVARVAGYRFDVKGAEADRVMDVAAELLVENPVDAAVEMEGRFASLPGDFEIVPAINQPAGRRVSKVGAYGLSRMIFPVAGHMESLRESPKPGVLELTEKNGGAILRLPVGFPVCRMKSTTAPPKIDGRGDDWPVDAPSRMFGEMTVEDRYLSRPDLVSGTMRMDEAPAIARWTYDDDYLYVLVKCPQAVVSDERNSEWPAQERRWWGTDGLQIQLASLGTLQGTAGGGRVVDMAFKPGGVMMVRMAQVKGVQGGRGLEWVEGPQGARYGMSVDKEAGRVKGYIVEVAIPRKWFGSVPENETAWRVNVLRHRGTDLASMSWSGPVVNDDDVAMMGLLVGE